MLVLWKLELETIILIQKGRYVKKLYLLLIFVCLFLLLVLNLSTRIIIFIFGKDFEGFHEVGAIVHCCCDYLPPYLKLSMHIIECIRQNVKSVRAS